MSSVQILIAVAAGVILFLFGIEQFSKEIQAITGERFRKFLAKATKNRFAGFLLGIVVTALIQSSTATSVIAVGLVNAGALSFRHTLGIIFGANVGTTVTAQLVALKLTDFAPALILVGFVAGLVPFRWKVLSRAIFYFGIVFFSLNLVSATVAPLRSDPEVIEMLSGFTDPISGVLIGALFTAIVQSSSVTTGIAIVLLQEQVLPLELALPLVFGANIGTTITALLASSSLDTSARRTAVSHALYNVGGVLLFLPLISPLASYLKTTGGQPAIALATAHLIFNAACAALALGLLRPFAALVERLVVDEDPESPLEPTPDVKELELGEALNLSRRWIAKVARRLLGQYTASVLLLQTRDSKIRSRAERLGAIVDYALSEGHELVYRTSKGSLSTEQSHLVLRLVVTLDHLRQLSDSLADLMDIDAKLSRRNIRFSMEALLDIQQVYPLTAKLLKTTIAAFDGDEDALAQAREIEAALGDALSGCYLRYIELARSPEEGSDLADFLSIHQRLRSKVLAFLQHLSEEGAS